MSKNDRSSLMFGLIKIKKSRRQNQVCQISMSMLLPRREEELSYAINLPGHNASWDLSSFLQMRKHESKVFLLAKHKKPDASPGKSFSIKKYMENLAA